jgi:hypothetical protein
MRFSMSDTTCSCGSTNAVNKLSFPTDVDQNGEVHFGIYITFPTDGVEHDEHEAAAWLCGECTQKVVKAMSEATSMTVTVTVPTEDGGEDVTLLDFTPGSTVIRESLLGTETIVTPDGKSVTVDI